MRLKTQFLAIWVSLGLLCAVAGGVVGHNVWSSSTHDGPTARELHRDAVRHIARDPIHYHLVPRIWNRDVAMR